MKFLSGLLFGVLFTSVGYSQDFLPALVDAENTFIATAAERGPKAAFLDFLTPDSILFRPQAVNGREYWTKHTDRAAESLVRKTIFADISSNGLLGYTTGNWRLLPKGKSESGASYGQYVTIWERKPDGRYRATLDIAINHDKLPFSATDSVGRVETSRDPNKRGWSPADASMNFHRMSMTGDRLGGAYEKFAARDVRLLIER